MALWQCSLIKVLIGHTDRGSQCCTKSHREILKAYKVLKRMSSKGDCWDNATPESFLVA